MSNRLSMAKINSIETLHQSGHSNRAIARLLGVRPGARKLASSLLPSMATARIRPWPGPVIAPDVHDPACLRQLRSIFRS